MYLRTVPGSSTTIMCTKIVHCSLFVRTSYAIKRYYSTVRTTTVVFFCGWKLDHHIESTTNNITVYYSSDLDKECSFWRFIVLRTTAFTKSKFSCRRTTMTTNTASSAPTDEHLAKVSAAVIYVIRD
jgi:hypothetical protein